MSLIRTDMVGIIDIPTTFYIWVMLALFAAPLSIGWYILPFWNSFLTGQGGRQDFQSKGALFGDDVNQKNGG